VKRAGKELLLGGQWKPVDPAPKSYEEQIYASVVRPGDVCYDVGANYGDVALYLAALIGPAHGGSAFRHHSGGIVVAFEPIWPTYTSLCKRVQSDNLLKSPIVPVPAGLSDKAGTAWLQVPNGDFGLGSLAPPQAWSEAQSGAAVKSHQGSLLTLDAFLSASGLPSPTFMKIDVEGAELLVLRGAEAMFASGVRPLMLIEIFAPWQRAFAYGPRDVFSFLDQRGYRFLFACPTGLVAHTPTLEHPFPPEYAMGNNVVAYVPALHAERVKALAPLQAPGAKLLPMRPPPHANTVLPLP
jgi:FkbM family methyltransferase